MAEPQPTLASLPSRPAHAQPGVWPMALPLKGSHLVEASAGTGKTWTIAALYVRLVLGHGEGIGRPLSPSEILVMTFTKAATRELSDRIRRRLVEAARFFREPEAAAAGGDSGRRGAAAHDADDFLRALRAAYPAGKERDQAAWRLSAAAEAMDDASVHTIDAWCQRMLREHAFDSGCLFDEELQPNETQMLRQAAQDYWRQQVYPLQAEALDTVLAQWGSVWALVEDVRSLVEKPLPAVDAGRDLADLLSSLAEERGARLAEIKRAWSPRIEAMAAWLERELTQKKPKVVNLQWHHVEGWLKVLRHWVADADADVPALTETAWERLTHDDLVARAKGPLPPDLPEGFEAMALLRTSLAALPDARPRLRAHALTRIRQRMQHLKRQAGRYGYADMLQRLDDALDERERGAHAAELRRRILAQYPAALIDEFQDTSPRQLSIFDRVYRIADDEPSRVLLLIGDPKQSIYAFRGADIHSYLRARRATTGRHHALDTNRRSTTSLVEAVNTLFERAEARDGRGAFLFRGQGAADGEGLPFVPVQDQGRREVLQRGGTAHAAFTFCVDDELVSLREHRRRFAAVCAERIVQLLGDASAVFVAEGECPRRLLPRDIAVLVRTGAEAEAVQRALRRRNVASVYLSDKDSVYQQPEAADLLRLLQAVAEPRNVRLARAAFATRLLGRTLPELHRLATDDLAFDAMCDRLRTLHAVWQAQGVLAMLRQALHLFEIPARLLTASDAASLDVDADEPSGGTGGATGDGTVGCRPARADTRMDAMRGDAAKGQASFVAGHDGEGERRLTNVLHLAELLQAASTGVEGEPALVRWLHGQIEAAAGDYTPAEDLVLRLESDADLVQVVTVHKSKGLEYPVVFVPFAAGLRPVEKRNTTAVLRRDAEGHRELQLAPAAEDLAAGDEERLQEDLRLLYVALTRAKNALWVGAAALTLGTGKECQWHRSALGYLVSGEAPREASQIRADLQALADATPAIVLEAPASYADVPFTRWLPAVAETALPPARAYDGSFERHWGLASYSGLVREALRDASHGAPAAAPAPEPVLTRLQRDDDDDEAALEDPGSFTEAGEGASGAPRPRGSEAPWHRFPRGAFAGNFLHDQLEWLAGEGFALADSPPLQQALLRRCERQGWGHRGADVVAWLQRVVSQPLPPLGAALADLDGRVLPEMEFWLPADGLDAARLDALCREHLFPHEPRPALTARRLRGLLMGFADLVFEHEAGGSSATALQGEAPGAVRYWVLDYKSNALGLRDGDYTEAAMRTAMLRHRYDVQAALYLLALHRLLRRRLGTRYDPARDIGGAIYYFLRGVGHAGAGCQHLTVPPALLDALEAMLS